jgi:large subunit ribosomal protein L10
VSSDLANVLAELGIEPKEVGLDLRGVYGDGVLFESEDLEIDVEEYESDVATAASFARNLAINASFPTASTLPAQLGKASGEAKSLGLQAGIEDPDVMPDLIGKADGQVRALAAQIDDEEALPEELQGVDAPAVEESDDDQTDDSEADDADADTDSEADEADDDDDEDGDGGEALGNMFG